MKLPRWLCCWAGMLSRFAGAGYDPFRGYLFIYLFFTLLIIIDTFLLLNYILVLIFKKLYIIFKEGFFFFTQLITF